MILGDRSEFYSLVYCHPHSPHSYDLEAGTYEFRKFDIKCTFIYPHGHFLNLRIYAITKHLPKFYRNTLTQNEERLQAHTATPNRYQQSLGLFSPYQV